MWISSLSSPLLFAGYSIAIEQESFKTYSVRCQMEHVLQYGEQTLTWRRIYRPWMGFFCDSGTEKVFSHYKTLVGKIDHVLISICA